MAASTFYVPRTIDGSTAGIIVATDIGKTGSLAFFPATGSGGAPTTGQIWPRGRGV
jgi:hypothetical protein